MKYLFDMWRNKIQSDGTESGGKEKNNNHTEYNKGFCKNTVILYFCEVSLFKFSHVEILMNSLIYRITTITGCLAVLWQINLCLCAVIL